MSSLDSSGFALGVVGFASQFFYTGVQAYERISVIRDLSKDAQLHATLMAAEQIRFKKWAERVGLENFEQEFESRFQNHGMTYAVTLGILRQICDVTTRYGDFESKYGLKLQGSGKTRTDDEPEEMVPRSSDITLAWINSDEAKLDWENWLLTFQRRISKMKKMQWAVSDKNKLKTLRSCLRELNDALVAILPEPERRTLQRSLIIDQPGNATWLDIYANADAISTAYATAARFKREMLTSNNQTQPHQPRAAQLNENQLPDSTNQQATRYLVGVDNTTILVEEKTIPDPNSAIGAKSLQRIHQLTNLLHFSPKPDVYRVLDCVGYRIIRLDDNGQRWKLAFALPREISQSRDPWQLSSLRDLLRDGSNTTPPTDITLGERFRLAAIMANSILHIHAAGWYHRDVSSANVVCFSRQGERSIHYPYLCGFNYARVDARDEFSEIAGRELRSNLHMHPDYLLADPNNTRVKYKRSFEYYSLGVMLIEIGLWKRIDAMFTPLHSAHTFSRFLRQRVLPVLGHQMGELYRGATERCLDMHSHHPVPDEGPTFLEAFSRYVVQELEATRA